MIPDRTQAPPSYPVSIDQVAFPEKYSFAGRFPGFIIHDDNQPVVIFELILATGKVAEQIGGESHFALKMLLEGTSSKTAEDISFSFEKDGSYFEITPGMENSSVRLYVLEKNFEKGLQLVKELLFDSKFPERQYQLLKSIRKSNISNQLAKNNRLATLKFNELLFGSKHPLGKVIRPEMLEIPLRVVKSFFDTNVLVDPRIILAGKVDSNRLRYVDDWLKAINFAETVTTVDAYPTEVTDKQIENGNGTQASLRWGSETIGENHDEIHQLRVANSLLGGFFGSRLMSKIREEKGLTYGIYSTLVHTQCKSYWMIGSELNAELLGQAQSAIEDEINFLASTTPEEKELDLLRNYLKGKNLMYHDSLFSKINFYKTLLIQNQGVNYIQKYWQTIEEINAEEISNAVDKYFRQPPLTRLVVV